MDLMKEAMELLKVYGAYAGLVFLGAALVKKDKYIEKLHGQILTQAVASGQAMTAMTEVIRGMKATLEAILDRAPRRNQ